MSSSEQENRSHHHVYLPLGLQPELVGFPRVPADDEQGENQSHCLNKLHTPDLITLAPITR